MQAGQALYCDALHKGEERALTAERPVFLRLWQIHLPPTGLVSILHRVSGLLLVLSIPVAAALLGLSLTGPKGFATVAAIFEHWLGKVGLVLLAWSLVHHLFAGLRHLLLDIGAGVELGTARRSARVATLAAPLVVLLGWGLLQ